MVSICLYSTSVSSLVDNITTWYLARICFKFKIYCVNQRDILRGVELRLLLAAFDPLDWIPAVFSQIGPKKRNFIQEYRIKIWKLSKKWKGVKRSDGVWRFACFCLILQSSTLRKFRKLFCKCCAIWPFSRSACWYKRQFSQIAPLWTNWKTSMHLPLCGCKKPAGQFYITCPVGIGLGCISKWLGWIPTVTEDMVDIVLEVTEVMVATAMAMASNMFCNSSVEFHFAMP